MLVGDNGLLACHKPGVHAPLRSRLGYRLQLGPLNTAQSRQYVEQGLHSASIHASPFQPEALELLVQASGGLPRTINHLAQRSMEAAAAQNSVNVTAARVHRSLTLAD